MQQLQYPGFPRVSEQPNIGDIINMIARLHLHDPYARSAPLFRAIASEIMNNTVPADDLAPLGARTSAGAVVIKLGSLYVRERYLNG